MIHWGIVFIIASLSFMAGWIVKGKLSRESAATELFIQMDEAERMDINEQH